MKQIFQILIVVLLSGIGTFAQNVEETDQIILKLKVEDDSYCKSFCNSKSTGSKKVDSISKKFGATKIKRQSAGKKRKQHLYIIKFPQGTHIQEVIDEYIGTGEIEYAEPDHKGSGGGSQGFVPTDPFYYRQWGLKNDGTFTLSPSVAGADIEMENAWGIEQGDSNIVVGIIDSGAKLDHPEFTGRIWMNYNEIQNNGIDDDNNGFIDDLKGWDFAYSDNNPMDDEGHGTNVAGIIGANGNNSMGYSGVDWHCKLMILKGIDSANFGYYSWWADAMYYAVDNGARVLNLSLGGTSSSTTLQNAVTYAVNNNVVVVVSMGNADTNIASYPSVCTGAIAVGSTNSNDNRTSPFFWSVSSGSNYGNHISVVAPGNYIYGLSNQSNTNYNSYWGGTSQAAPHVTALASLLLAQNPSLTPGQVKSILENTAEDQIGNPSEDTPGWDQYYGHGRINAFNALSNITSVLKNENEHQTVTLFPNPTQQDFTIKFQPCTQQVEIFNSLGESVQSKRVEGLSMQHFQLIGEGIYFVQIVTPMETIRKKIIVCR